MKAAIGFYQPTAATRCRWSTCASPTPTDAEGVSAANPLMGFDKNDIMRAVELGVLALVAGLILFFVIRPLIRSASAGWRRRAARR